MPKNSMNFKLASLTYCQARAHYRYKAVARRPLSPASNPSAGNWAPYISPTRAPLGLPSASPQPLACVGSPSFDHRLAYPETCSRPASSGNWIPMFLFPIPSHPNGTTITSAASPRAPRSNSPSSSIRLTQPGTMDRKSRNGRAEVLRISSITRGLPTPPSSDLKT